jgi:hypothetical protein
MSFQFELPWKFGNVTHTYKPGIMVCACEIPALCGMRQKDHKFEGSLGYKERLCPKKETPLYLFQK